MAGILAVVANIKNDDLKAVQKQPPERVVRIDGKSVSMTEQQSLFTFTVTTHTNDGTVIHADVHRLRRRRNFECHRLQFQVMSSTILPLACRPSKRVSAVPI